jgi:hypothetical protein
MVQTSGRLDVSLPKRFNIAYIDAAYYSKAYGAINHFEIPLRGIKAPIIGHTEKKIPMPTNEPTDRYVRLYHDVALTYHTPVG